MPRWVRAGRHLTQELPSAAPSGGDVPVPAVRVRFTGGADRGLDDLLADPVPGDERLLGPTNDHAEALQLGVPVVRLDRVGRGSAATVFSVSLICAMGGPSLGHS